MSTHCITRIHSSDKNSPIILTMYRHYDGGFETHGVELTEFLRNIKHMGMDCLAAQIVAKFKTEIGNIRIVCADHTEEYVYDVFEKNNGIFVEGENALTGEVRILLGNPEPYDLAEFVYQKNLYDVKWRKIKLTEQNQNYVCGFDFDDNMEYKRFSVDKIVGGRSKIKITHVEEKQ